MDRNSPSGISEISSCHSSSGDPGSPRHLYPISNNKYYIKPDLTLAEQSKLRARHQITIFTKLNRTLSAFTRCHAHAEEASRDYAPNSQGAREAAEECATSYRQIIREGMSALAHIKCELTHFDTVKMTKIYRSKRHRKKGKEMGRCGWFLP